MPAGNGKCTVVMFIKGPSLTVKIAFFSRPARALVLGYVFESFSDQYGVELVLYSLALSIPVEEAGKFCVTWEESHAKWARIQPTSH